MLDIKWEGAIIYNVSNFDEEVKYEETKKFSFGYFWRIWRFDI